MIRSCSFRFFASMNRNKHSSLLIATLILLTAPLGCVEEEPVIVPDVPICIGIDLTLASYRDLRGIGNAYKYPNQGYNSNGVIIFRRTEEEFYAWDATCPQHMDKIQAVGFNDGFAGGSVACPHCKTVYLLHNFARPDSGFPLKSYRVAYGDDYIKVYHLNGVNCNEYDYP